MKASKSSIMTTAWVIAKAAALKFGGSAKQYLSGALKQSWGNAMEIIETLEEKLVRFGGKLWEKETVKRIYLNQSVMESALDFGGFQIGKAKLWFDCKTQQFHSDNGTVRVNFNQRGIKCSK